MYFILGEFCFVSVYFFFALRGFFCFLCAPLFVLVFWMVVPPLMKKPVLLLGSIASDCHHGCLIDLMEFLIGQRAFTELVRFHPGYNKLAFVFTGWDIRCRDIYIEIIAFMGWGRNIPLVNIVMCHV